MKDQVPERSRMPPRRVPAVIVVNMILAVSGPIVIGVAIACAIILLLYLLKIEDEEEARDRAESDS
jgi:hypothetical protein